MAKKKIEIPEKIPYMSGEYSPAGGYIEKIILIDKTHPKWEKALETYLDIKSSKLSEFIEELENK